MAHQIRAQETRQKILSAAATCFSRIGYDAASVSSICTEAGVTKGAFYYHFPSKQALFLDLINLWLADLDLNFLGARQESKNVPESLAKMARFVGASFSNSANYMPIFLEFWLHSIRDPQIWELTIQPYRRYLNYFVGVIQDGVAEGSFRPHQENLSARALISMAIGLVLTGLMDPTANEWDKSVPESVKTFLEGIQK